MKVIVNATPLIGLAVVNQLNLLRQIFDHIIVPTTVYEEVIGQGWNRPGAQRIADAEWLQVVSPTAVSTMEPRWLQ
jgi:predicted nucleic acid-binding protein